MNLKLKEIFRGKVVNKAHTINTGVDEFKILKSQIVTSRWGGVRKLPLAFTEQGIAMLSGILQLFNHLAISPGRSLFLWCG